MSPFLRRGMGVAGAVALAVALTACGGTSAAQTTTAAVTQVDSIDVAMPGPITGIDPANTILLQNVWFLHLIGGTLFSYVPNTTDEVEPALAESATLSSDELTATVTLKPDLTFTDGTPLTANDVAATYTRDLGLSSGIGAIFYRGIESVTAEGDDTVVFTFSAPNPNYQAQLALFPFAIVPAGSWDEDGFATSLVSAGQYKVDGDISGNTVTLVANDDYAGTKPSVDELVFHVVADSTSAVNQLQGGQLQMVTQLAPTSAGTLGSSATVEQVDTWGITVLGANATDSILSDQKVREAIGNAIDRTSLATIATSGISAPLLGPYSENFPGSDESFNQIYSATADLDTAAELLEGTSCENGCELSLTYNTSSAFANSAAVVLQSQLKEIGITVQLLPFDQTTYNTKAFSGDFQLLLTGGGGFGLTQATALLLDPSGPTKAMFSNWSDDEVSAAVDAVYSADKDSQVDALESLATLFAADTPWIPLTTNPSLWAVRSDLAAQIFFSPTGLLDVAPAPAQ
ncbi:MAG: ABC transporter substrate-binding protein [Microbacterium sp.]|uniref:ABC transporter substrate-binding protein n=1 Tax=Microbacterium sp. TaxID=51671 RepID=UPI0039E3327A